MSVHLEQRIASLERMVRNMMRPATVDQRDHEKGVRFKIGESENGEPILTSWVQPPDQNKGKRSRLLPDVGAQALVFTPPGFEQAMSFAPMSHHENSQNPAGSADESVLFDDGTCRISINGGAITLNAGASTVTISGGTVTIEADAVQVNGSYLKHNSKEIGHSHTHGSVTPGPGTTGAPT